jgi:replicative DNA helicase
MTDPDGNSNEGIAEIIIAKHRSGSVGDVRLQFTKELIKFSNTDERPYNSYGSAMSPVTQDFGSRSNHVMPIEPSTEAPF